MMFDFYIDNADCLIHYDIPDGKKTFSMRFSVLQDSNKMFVVSCLYWISIIIKMSVYHFYKYQTLSIVYNTSSA